ncbi:GGDEF domain-containing protein [Lysobacter sp. A3-1-A15]|uniref:GGDEF domain-containing protein n=1 Tax=Novilysobacter viscosus TaxID=3098602 RepID=UPI002EDAA8D0
MKMPPSINALFANAHSVPAAYRPHQAAVVRARLGQLAPIVAGLSALWIVVDATGLGAASVAQAAPVRLLIATALLAIWHLRGRLPMHVCMASFIWVQAIGFGTLQHMLGPREAGLSLGYGLFPFVIAAQLAIFPLTWARSLRLGLAPAALLLSRVLTGHQPLDDAFTNDVWLLVLILGLSAWGGHMQVRLLVDLLGAQRDATLDPLTGLANRRYAEKRLHSDRAHALRRGEPLSVAMVDLDHFKRVNDTWGHAGGDLALVAVAAALQGQLRGSDLGARFGGEEFLVVLPDAETAQALRVAERIRERIAELGIEAPGGSFGVAASIGIASLRGDESIGELLARADAALYRSKAEGRNRCTTDIPVAPSDEPLASPA